MSALAAAGWVVLLLGRRWPTLQRVVCAVIIPALLALAYAALYPALYVQSPGGYASIDDLRFLLNAERGVVLAAWLHYLAFDLLVGWWMGQDARQHMIPHFYVVPCQLLTFLFGLLGWLAYMTVRAYALWRTGHSLRASTATQLKSHACEP